MPNLFFKKTTWFYAGTPFALLIPASFIYLPLVLSGVVFVSDDITVFFNNPAFILGNNESWANFIFSYQVREYVPVGWLFVLGELMAFGPDPVAIRAVSFALHFSLGIVIFATVRVLSKDKAISFFVALIFICHPVNVETIGMVACQFWQLAALFSWGSLLLYTISWRIHQAEVTKAPPQLFWYIISLVFFALAVYSKSPIIAFVVAFPAVNHFFLNMDYRKNGIWSAPFVALCILKGAESLYGSNVEFLTPVAGYTGGNLITSFLSSFPFLFKSFLNLLLPVITEGGTFRPSLATFYSFEIVNETDEIILSIIKGSFTIVTLWCIWILSGRTPLVTFGLIIYFSFRLLFLGLIPGQWWIHGDRYDYPGGIGIWIAILFSFSIFARKRKRNRAFKALTGTIIFLFFLLASVQRNVWLHRDRWELRNQSARYGSSIDRAIEAANGAKYYLAKIQITPFQKETNISIPDEIADVLENYVNQPEAGYFLLFQEYLRIIAVQSILDQGTKKSFHELERLHRKFPETSLISLYLALYHFQQRHYATAYKLLNKWESSPPNQWDRISRLIEQPLYGNDPRKLKAWFALQGNTQDRLIHWGNYWLYLELKTRLQILAGDHTGAERTRRLYQLLFPRAYSLKKAKSIHQHID